MSRRSQEQHRSPSDSPASDNRSLAAMAVHAPLPQPMQDRHSPGYGYDGDRNLEIPALSRCSSYTNPSVVTASPLPRLTSLTSILNPSTSPTSSHDMDEDESPRRRKLPYGLSRMASLPAMGPSSLDHRDGTETTSLSRPELSKHDIAQRPMLTPYSPLHRSRSTMKLNEPTNTSRQHYETMRRPSPESLPAMTDSSRALRSLREHVAPVMSRPGRSHDYHPAVSHRERMHEERYDPPTQYGPPPEQRQHRLPPGSTRPLPPTHITSHPYERGYVEYERPYSEESDRSPPKQSRSGPGSSNQSSYQVVAVQTSSGMMQLPVDVALASKIANDRRRRNAGASARFRSRRKERDMIAAEKIRDLERISRELTGAVDHYKAERDHFRRLTQTQIKQEDQEHERPPSPAVPTLQDISSAGSSVDRSLSRAMSNDRQLRGRTTSLESAESI